MAISRLKHWSAYLHYFFYLGYHWNFRLACFIIRHEVRGEKKYGIKTVGVDDLKRSVPEVQRKHASVYQPVNYFIAEWLFSQLNESDRKTGFLDAGCGRGRAMAMAMHMGFGHVEGFDISAQLCHEAIQILEPLESKFSSASWTVVQANAKDYAVGIHIGVIFLFNPFDEVVMRALVAQVRKSLRSYPRTLKVLYANPQCKQAWLDAGFTEAHHIRKMGWLEASVLVWNQSVSDNNPN